VSEGITSVLSALRFLNPGLHLMQTLFTFLNLKQSSQLFRILLITCNFSFTSFWGIQSLQHITIADAIVIAVVITIAVSTIGVITIIVNIVNIALSTLLCHCCCHCTHCQPIGGAELNHATEALPMAC
jgi:hypothetical protein